MNGSSGWAPGEENAHMEHENGLGRVMTAVIKDDTKLFKQFGDNDSFRKWLSEMMFSMTYDSSGSRAGAPFVRGKNGGGAVGPTPRKVTDLACAGHESESRQTFCLVNREPDQSVAALESCGPA
jgi:hypothetical protein